MVDIYMHSYIHVSPCGVKTASALHVSVHLYLYTNTNTSRYMCKLQTFESYAKVFEFAASYANIIFSRRSFITRHCFSTLTPSKLTPILFLFFILCLLNFYSWQNFTFFIHLKTFIVRLYFL